MYIYKASSARFFISSIKLYKLAPSH